MRTRRKKKTQPDDTKLEGYDGYLYLFFPPANKKNIDATKEWARKNNYPVEVCDVLPSGACVFRVKDADFEWLPKEPINKWNEDVRGLCIPDVVHGEGCDPFYPPWSLARCNPVQVLTKNWVAINCKKRRNRGITNVDAPDIRSRTRNNTQTAQEGGAGDIQRETTDSDSRAGDNRRGRGLRDNLPRRRRRAAPQV